MIQIKNGKTKLKGYTGDLIMEFLLLTHSMTNMLEEELGREKAIKILDEAYRSGKMTKEEMEAEVAEILAKRAKEGKQND